METPDRTPEDIGVLFSTLYSDVFQAERDLGRRPNLDELVTIAKRFIRNENKGRRLDGLSIFCSMEMDRDRRERGEPIIFVVPSRILSERAFAISLAILLSKRYDEQKAIETERQKKEKKSKVPELQRSAAVMIANLVATQKNANKNVNKRL